MHKSRKYQHLQQTKAEVADSTLIEVYPELCWKVSLTPRLYSGQNRCAGGTRRLCSLGISYAVQLWPSRVAQRPSGGRPPETSTVPNRDSVTARGRHERMKEGASASFQLPPRSVDFAMA
jgi:hypothetical protein